MMRMKTFKTVNHLRYYPWEIQSFRLTYCLPFLSVVAVYNNFAPELFFGGKNALEIY